MKRSKQLERALWALAIVAAALGARSARQVGRPSEIPWGSTRRSDSLDRPPAESIPGWAARAAARDPFRLQRRPMAVRFGVQTPVSQVPRPPRPQLVLLGTLGGPPWSAVLEGIPGVSGSRVVHEGEVVGPLTIRYIGHDSALVVGLDSAWTLTTRGVSP